MSLSFELLLDRQGRAGAGAGAPASGPSAVDTTSTDCARSQGMALEGAHDTPSDSRPPVPAAFTPRPCRYALALGALAARPETFGQSPGLRRVAVRPDYPRPRSLPADQQATARKRSLPRSQHRNSPLFLGYSGRFEPYHRSQVGSPPAPVVLQVPKAIGASADHLLFGKHRRRCLWCDRSDTAGQYRRLPGLRSITRAAPSTPRHRCVTGYEPGTPLSAGAGHR